MSSEQELIRPADKTVELLLRSFLESETKHREQQTEEHRAINRSLASIGREVADTNSKVIELDLKFTQHGKDIESLSTRVEKVEGNADEVSEETGRHELSALQAELDRRNELLKAQREARQHWVRWFVGIMALLVVTLTGTWFGYFLKGHEAQAAPRPTVDQK